MHGLGGHEGIGWGEEWRAAVTPLLPPGTPTEFHYAGYDPLFATIDLGPIDTIEALLKLGWSGASALLPRRRAFGVDVLSALAPAQLRLTAGYVVAWVANDQFRREIRRLLLDRLRETQPDVILAHSLGSLLTYDAFAHRDAAEPAAAAALARAHYVTLGSQLGNPFVRGNLTHGRTQWLPVRRWTHLYNEHDQVLGTTLQIPDAPQFLQVATPFTQGNGHSAALYLSREATAEALWRPEAMRAATGQPETPEAVPMLRALEVPAEARAPKRRALLVGINDYPREADRLEGCVNDVYTISAALQDCGFQPEEIRLCLNDRATAAGILERMGWLFDGARAGDRLVFYYSGHGARMPRYGASGQPERMTEMLVPWDCAWTPETIVSDEQIHGLYSQLPYDTQALIMLDCCHSGGLHRQGSQRARGIEPPDDIRHRALKWDGETEMWVPRDFQRMNSSFSRSTRDAAAFFGRDGATERLFRATPLRNDSYTVYDKAQKAADAPIGPFLPIIIEACKEAEFSYEYRHGVTSYGAFTFIVASLLRTVPGITFRQLVEMARQRLADLDYAQEPQVLGPGHLLDQPIPFRTGQARTIRRDPDNPGSATPPTSG
ncbi:caspase family protein [Frigidibacter sp. MR17.24]|uniref:caspase family protein n=1 Tax=Frigidibacter sp. MR17.24 TaxID=3127345 RepID=UPI0030131525